MTRSVTPVLSENNESVQLANEKLTQPTDLCEKSTMDNSILNSPTVSPSSTPSKESIQSQLTRRTKECETAKKLIDTMRVHRERDSATISDLHTRISALASVDSHNTTKLHDQVSLLRDELKRKKEDLITATNHLKEKEDELTQLYMELSRRDKAISEIQKTVSGRDLQLSVAKSECEVLEQQLQNATTELDDLRLRSRREKQSLNAELQTFKDESATVRWQLEKQNLETTNKLVHSINSLKSDLKDREDLNQQLNIQLADIKAKLNETKKEVHQIKSEASRRISASGAQQSRFEARCLELQKKLDLTKKECQDLQEENDNLLLQQSAAIEKLATSSKMKELATERINSLTEKLSVVEKQFTSRSSQLRDVKERGESLKAEVKKSIENQHHLENELGIAKNNTVRMSIFSALIVLILAKLFLV